MAARTVKIRHDESTRAKIRASQLIRRLQSHALGECEMTPTQVRAAEVCLKKVLPDLVYSESRNTHEYRYAEVPKTLSPEEWLRAVEDPELRAQHAGTVQPLLDAKPVPASQ